MSNHIRGAAYLHGPNQKIKLEAYAKLGKGRHHAKWQPVTISTLTDTDNGSEFHLTLESTGSLPANEILLEATSILNTKLNCAKIFSKEVFPMVNIFGYPAKMPVSQLDFMLLIDISIVNVPFLDLPT